MPETPSTDDRFLEAEGEDPLEGWELIRPVDGHRPFVDQLVNSLRRHDVRPEVMLSILYDLDLLDTWRTRPCCLLCGLPSDSTYHRWGEAGAVCVVCAGYAGFSIHRRESGIAAAQQALHRLNTPDGRRRYDASYRQARRQMLPPLPGGRPSERESRLRYGQIMYERYHRQKGALTWKEIYAWFEQEHGVHRKPKVYEAWIREYRGQLE